MVWSRQRLAWAFLAFGACAPVERPPSLLLLTLDTTNPEALGAYGGPPGLTPSLDRLAREGVVFEDARAVAPLTLPAHASMLTGLYPLRHAVRRNGETRLAAEATTLAERAREHGYETAAFLAAVVLTREFGLDQGFDTYDAPVTPEQVEEHLAASRSAAEIAARANAWLAGRDAARPFFLWLHFYDPHFPYRPPAAFAARNDEPYLAEVAAMDGAIAEVLRTLEAADRYDDTLIVALADHGEGRGRHDEETHGAFVFDSTLRIPFVARLPAGRRAGERVRACVSQVDLAPLVAAELGLGAWPGDGRDPLGATEPRGVYFESHFGTRSFGWSALAGYTDGRAKYVHSSTPELFDLASDPGETRNALEGSPETAAALRAEIQRLAGEPRLAREPLAGGHDELQREIERLGYAGASGESDEPDPEPLAPSTRPSPHRLTRAYADYMEGRRLFEEGAPRAQAIALLERALAANPENHKAWFTLGLAAMELARFEQAAAAFTRVVGMSGGERIPAQLNLAVSLYNLGRAAEALRELERALAATDGPPGALELLVRLLEEAGRVEEAARARDRLVARRASGSAPTRP